MTSRLPTAAALLVVAACGGARVSPDILDEPAHGSIYREGGLELAPGSRGALAPGPSGSLAGLRAADPPGSERDGPAIHVTPTLGAGADAVPNAASSVAILRKWIPGCVRRALDENASGVAAAAQLQVAANLRRDGRVTSVTASQDVGLSAAAVDCIQHRVASVPFSPPAGGAATLVISLQIRVER